MDQRTESMILNHLDRMQRALDRIAECMERAEAEREEVRRASAALFKQMDENPEGSIFDALMAASKQRKEGRE